MGRLHSNGKGISASAIPYSRSVPAWLKTTPEQVVDQICKLAKKGVTPSQIGVILRDSHGVAQVKIVTGMFGVLRISSRKKRLLTFLRLQVTRSSGSSRATVWIERLLENTGKRWTKNQYPAMVPRSSAKASAADNAS
jgi:small subunit ribosomal protein S13e